MDTYMSTFWRGVYLSAWAVILLSQPSIASAETLAERWMRHLESRIATASESLVGVMGVAAQRTDGGPRVLFNSDSAFPMASTYKIAIAATVLATVDRGDISLDDMVAIKPDELIAGSGKITTDFYHRGVAVSVANLVELMITESDNTATDKLLGLVGGTAAVTKQLEAMGVTDQRVDRATAEILQDFYNLDQPATASFVAEVFTRSPELITKLSIKNLRFETDERDQSTPAAMLELLLALDRGHLSSHSTTFLLSTLSRTRTGDTRLRALLPLGTPIAHKTGTIGGVANDVGFVNLPDGSQLAIVVFTKSSDSDPEMRDRSIAEVARVLFEGYLLLGAL